MSKAQTVPSIAVDPTVAAAAAQFLSPVVLGLALGVVLGTAGFVAVERRAPDPIIPLGLFRDRIFTAAVVGVDPDPHRGSFRVRAAVLVGFVAVHSALAKHLYGHPPDGVGASDARTGAQLMYYGGDVVDVALIVVLFAQWYAAGRPRVRAARSAA